MDTATGITRLPHCVSAVNRLPAWLTSWGLYVIALCAMPGHAIAALEEPSAVQGGDGVVTTEAYIADRTFNGGLYFADAFAGSPSRDYLGQKIIRLENGDVIVAGVVPASGGGTNLLNLGLVRYNAAGVRVAWTNPGAFGVFGNQYVVFPNTNDPLAFEQVVNVLDMKRLGNRIFLLTDKKYPGSDGDSRVLVFGTDGSYLAQTTVFGTTLDEYAGGLLVYEESPESVRIMVVGSTFNAVWRPTFRSGIVAANGTIVFAPIVYPNPANYCPTNRGCILRSIAAGGALQAGPPTRFYLAGSRQSAIPDNGNWDYLVMSVRENGGPNVDFNASGVQTVAFDRGRDNYDDARSIVVRPDFYSGVVNGHDDIYVVGNVNQACRAGIGIAKVKQYGELDPQFGDELSPGGARSGLLVVGGSSALGGTNCFARETEVGADAALSGSGFGTLDGYLTGKLAVAGYLSIDNAAGCSGNCAEDRYEAVLYVFKSLDGTQLSANYYPFASVPGGINSTRHTALFGLTASGDFTFTATGSARFFQTAIGQPQGKNQYVTMRFRNNTIFRDSFGGD